MRDERELSTWKEVANYFGKSVRTVQQWERLRGLPVKRLGDSSHIVAYIDELEAWKEAQLIERHLAKQAPDPAPGPSPRPPVFSRRAVLGAAAGITIVGAGIGATFIRRPRLKPSVAHLDGHLLKVFDARNEPLWEHVFEHSFKPHEWTTAHRFVDLGDGRASLLIAADRALYCFRDDGSVAWTHRYDRVLTSVTGRNFEFPYSTFFVGVLNRPTRAGGRIVAHFTCGPTALSVTELLDAQGQPVGQYVHAGWFFCVATGTLDRNGREDIFLGGVDDAAGDAGPYRATLVVLDPERFSGQASTLLGTERALRDIPPAREKAVILIHDFGEARDPNVFCNVARIYNPSTHLDVTALRGSDTVPGAHFIFDQNLRLTDVVPEHVLEDYLLNGQLKSVAPAHRHAATTKLLGDLKYVRNEFH